MSEPLAITHISFTTAQPHHRARGHEGWVTFVVAGAIRIDGVRVRRTEDGTLSLSFPARRDRSGHMHSLASPISASARQQIESKVFAGLADVLPKERK